MNIQSLLPVLLDEAAEDYVALHEIAADVRARMDQRPEGEVLRLSREIVETVLKDHGGRLYRTETWPPSTFEPLDVSDYRTALAIGNTWRVPPDDEPPVMYWLSIE